MGKALPMRDISILVRLRFLLQAGLDASCWFVAISVAQLLRFDFEYGSFDATPVLIAAAVIGLVQVAVGRGVGLYIHRWRYGTFEELGAAMFSAGVVTVLATAAFAPTPDRKVVTQLPTMSG